MTDTAFSPTMRVDLNADLGEDASHTSTAMLQVVTSANVACGVHAGDPLVMHRTIEAATARGVAVGAHPSYPDRENFGRKSMFGFPDAPLTESELHAVIHAQLTAFASMTGGQVPYVKAHGALYNDAQVNSKVAEIVAYQAALFGAAVVGQPGSRLQAACAAQEGRYIAEVFADRGYDHDGTLIPRTMPHAMHTNPDTVGQRVVRMVTDGTVESYGFDHKVSQFGPGTYTFPGPVDTICVHGDTRGAVEIARAVRSALEQAGVALSSGLTTGTSR